LQHEKFAAKKLLAAKFAATQECAEFPPTQECAGATI
jgi:hypothetical protein